MFNTQLKMLKMLKTFVCFESSQPKLSKASVSSKSSGSSGQKTRLEQNCTERTWTQWEAIKNIRFCWDFISLLFSRSSSLIFYDPITARVGGTKPKVLTEPEQTSSSQRWPGSGSPDPDSVHSAATQTEPRTAQRERRGINTETSRRASTNHRAGIQQHTQTHTQ